MFENVLVDGIVVLLDEGEELKDFGEKFDGSLSGVLAVELAAVEEAPVQGVEVLFWG